MFIIILIIILVILLLDREEKFTDLSVDKKIQRSQEDKITFIIPTIGRDTLMSSIQSLINQSNKSWNAIIVFDGIKPTIKVEDPRIQIISISKKGRNINSAGLVRNEGIKLVKTKWIAFLDDDDYLAENYIDVFYNELRLNPDSDVIIYRMVLDDNILPNLGDDNFYVNKVGISFCYKKEIFDNGMIFVPSKIEDFTLLDKLRNNKYKMIISPYTTYFVRKFINYKTLPLGPRIKINY